MVKIIGKVKKVNREPLYYVKKKDRNDCTNVEVLTEMGRSSLMSCQGTCDLLNNAPENRIVKKRAGKVDTYKKFFYFPSLRRYT